MKNLNIDFFLDFFFDFFILFTVTDSFFFEFLNSLHLINDEGDSDQSIQEVISYSFVIIVVVLFLYILFLIWITFYIHRVFFETLLCHIKVQIQFKNRFYFLIQTILFSFKYHLIISSSLSTLSNSSNISIHQSSHWYHHDGCWRDSISSLMMLMKNRM